MARTIEHRYDDPLDLIWLECLRAVGLELERSPEVYASFDGARTLTLSTREHFDADDSLAQLIFHELCHALVSGPRGLRLSDWGMENVDQRDLLQEHACLRLQAALADRYGLRGLFAVTTDHRSYWDQLGIDPLSPGDDDDAVPIARDALDRATRGPWATALRSALARTRALAAVMRELELPANSLWRRTRPLHASGFPLGDQGTCGECAWHGTRCRQAPKARVAASMQACVRFERALDCEACGACCRGAFDRVELRKREPVRPALKALVVVDVFGPHLPRPAQRCVALAPDANRCTIYEDRPRACADFAIGGDACLVARRRVGLSA